MSEEAREIEPALATRLTDLGVAWTVGDDNVMVLTSESQRALRLATWAVCETYKQAAGLSRDKIFARIQL